MPSFNFAKGKPETDEQRPAADTRHETTGRQRPVDPHSPGQNSDAMNASPTRSPGTANAADHSGGSILDKYPPRDLSHLTGTPVASSMPAAAQDDGGAGRSPIPDGNAVAQDADAATARRSDDPSPTVAEKPMRNSSGKGPLAAILAIVLFLVIVAFIWHVNPWPPLKDGITGLFRKSPAPGTEVPPPPAAVSQDDIPMRSWDYFIQVSSWRELTKADLDAERFRAQGFPTIVESEYLSAKGGTWYRVRLGPFESAADARAQLAANAGALPTGAYVDSVRLAEDQPVRDGSATADPTSATGAPTSARNTTAREPARARLASDASADGGGTRIPGRNFEVIDEPMSGWAVKVSSLKSVALARDEARLLLQQGYPSFITRKNLGGTAWYRVLVGPFTDRADADRYQQLLNVTHGNDAYTVNLANE